MAEHREDEEVFWVDPRRRGVLPLNRFHMSRSLAKAMRRAPYKVAIDQDFDAVVAACADRSDTWINDTLSRLYSTLHAKGHAHSFELWEDDELVGGVYGVTLGAAFFGESMFSRRTNASKMALVALVDHLRRGGFTLFDTQFLTEHLASLGAIEISRSDYQARLAYATAQRGLIHQTPVLPLQEVVQRMTQTS